MQRYNPKEIEPKWQDTQKQGIYKAGEDLAKNKKYIPTFPVPMVPYVRCATIIIGDRAGALQPDGWL